MATKGASSATASSSRRTSPRRSSSSSHKPRRRSRGSHRRNNNENDEDANNSEWEWRNDDDDDEPDKQPAVRSYGIAPKAFHGTTNTTNTASTTTNTTSASDRRRPRPGQQAIQIIHEKAQASLLSQRKQSVAKQNELQRAAFKKVTSLRTWPLQNRAFRHYRELMDEHLQTSKDEEEENDEDEEDHQQKGSTQKSSSSHNELSGEASSSSSSRSRGTAASSSLSQSSSSSSCYSSSGISSSGASRENEPKRVQVDTQTSPAQSRLKERFRTEFLAERALSGPILPRTNNNNNNDDGYPFTSSPLWSMEPRVFSAEKSGTGKRNYVVGHLGRFLDRYWRKADPHHRYYYELIPADTPCRLYLDLEFTKASNPDISDAVAEALLEELLLEINTEWQTLMTAGDATTATAATAAAAAAAATENNNNNNNNNKPTTTAESALPTISRRHVVDLDSSTDKKFSRHWIFHLPGGYLFAHTAAMRHFMHQLVGRLATAQSTGQLGTGSSGSGSGIDGRRAAAPRPLLQKYLFVNVSPSNKTADARQQTCFIDLGVYTRNRLFRLLGSSKFGKPPLAALRIAETNEFPFPAGFTNESFYLPAMKRSFCRERRQSAAVDADGDVDDGDQEEYDPDDLDAAIQKFQAASDWSLHAKALVDTLVVPINASKIAYPILPFDENAADAGASQEQGKQTKSTNTKLSTLPSNSYGQSPYPILDQFVSETLATRHGIQGSIRAWSIDRNADGVPIYITYQMKGNRWCECIGRAHKGNNIMWMIDLQLYVCIQSCHDPDCRAMRFRGTPVPLPEPVRDVVQDALFEEQLVSLDVESQFEKAFATLSIDENDSNNTNSNIKQQQQQQQPASVRVPSDVVVKKEKAEIKKNLDADSDTDDDIDYMALFNERAAQRKSAAASTDAAAAVVPKQEPGDGGEDEQTNHAVGETTPAALSDDALLDAMLSNPELFP